MLVNDAEHLHSACVSLTSSKKVLLVLLKAGFQSVEFCARGQRAEFFRRILLRAD